MAFPNWPYTQSPNMTLYEEMYDQQLHSCGNSIPSSSNWCNLEENFQITQSMADFSNPGELHQVFPMQSSPDLVAIQYDNNLNLSSWHNQEPGAQSHLHYSGEATWETPENPLFYMPGKATEWQNPQKTEVSVSNFLGQSYLNANYSQLEPPQFPNCVQSSENCFPFTSDALQEYDGVSMISSELEQLVNSMSGNTNHSVGASKAEFNDMICLENELEETLSQISRETNPGGSIVTTINDQSGMVNNSAGNHTQDVLAEFLNPEIDFRHALEDHHPHLKEASWVQAIQSSGMDFSEPGSSQRATVEEHSQAETTISPMKQMMYCAAALKPVNLHHEVVEKDQKLKKKNVKISSDPQTVAARQRRGRISERLKILQKLVPGGGKLDTASMLEEAANYLQFLKAQIKAFEDIGHRIDNSMTCMPMNLMFSPLAYYHSFPMGNNFSLFQLQNHTHFFHQPQD